MFRRPSLFIASLCASLACVSAQEQIIGSGVYGTNGGNAPGTTYLTAPIFLPQANGTAAAGYYQLAGTGITGPGSQAAAASADSPLATSGTISNLCVTSSQTSWVYAVTYDDSDTGLTVTGNGSTPVCDTNAAHNVTYAAGHKLTIHKSGGSTNDTNQISFLMTDSNGQYGSLFFGPTSATTTVGTQQYIGVGVAYNATENIVSVYFPTGGTIDNLYTNVTVATTSHFWTFAVQHHTTTTTPCDTNDTAANSLSTVYGSGASGILSDTNAGHAVTISAGDCVSIGVIGDTSTMTATRLYATLRWTPTTNYLYPEFATGTTMPTVTAARFGTPVGSQVGTWTATEATTYNLVPTLNNPAGGSFTMTAANVATAQSATIGTTRSWTMRQGTGTQSSISPTCSATTSNYTCGASSGSTSLTANDWIDWQTSNAATATATTWHKESYTQNVH